MAKMRVYELARELKLESKVLVTKIKDMGIDISSHQSTLSVADVEKIKASFGAAAPAASKPKVVVRRRRKKVAESEEDASAKSAEAAEASSTSEASEQKPSVEDVAASAVSETSSEGQTEAAGEKETEKAAVRDSENTSAVSEDGAEGEKQAEAASSDESEGDDSGVTAEGEAKSKLSAATRALIKARAKEKKDDGGSFQAAKIVRKSPGKSTKSTDSGSGNRYSLKGGEKAAPSSPVDVMPDVDGGFGKRPDRKKGGGTYTEEEVRARPVAKKERRASITTRDLLTGFEDEEEAPALPGKRKTVYMPSGGRKKDLKRRKDLKKTQITVPKASLRVVTMEDSTLTVGELAKQLSVKAGDVIKKLMGIGMMATINQALDEDTVTLIADEYKFEVKSKVKSVDELLGRGSAEDVTLQERPPIVTVMGHVDHGKTSILDAIREAEVVSGEAGGITQHIGAYTVEKDGKTVAFLDTPGHAAFSSMRARGAKVTDLVILVVAADDGVMPQTVEAISHAKDAEVPIIVAVNKMDKPNVNLDRVYTELAEHGIQSEEWGGEHQFVKVSALQKTGLDELIESVLLQSEMLELKAPVTVPARGSIIEAHLDKGRGPVATVMVTEGMLKRGDIIVAGQTTGRVRAMSDHKGKQLELAGPATPVEVIGLDAVPMSGDQVDVVTDDRVAKAVVDKRRETQLREASASETKATLEELLAKVASDEVPEVPFIVKGDTQGSVEAICEALQKIDSEKIKAKIVHKAVGGVNASDLALAETSHSVIFGFNVRASRGLGDEADSKGIVIKYFSIIYELIDAAKAIMAGNLPPVENEVVLGHAEVRNPISVPKVGTIAGSAVTDGKILRNCMLRLIRDDVVIHTGKIGSLRRFKDDVKEVNTGYECGIGIENYNDLKEGDVIEAFKIEETQATL